MRPRARWRDFKAVAMAGNADGKIASRIVLRPVANLIFRSDRPQPFPQGTGKLREPRVLCSRDRQNATIFGDVVRRYVGQVDPHLILANLGRSTHFLQDPRDHPALLLLGSTIPYVAANPYLAGGAN